MRRTDRGGAGYVGGVYPEDRDCEDLFTRDGLDPKEIHGVEDAGGVKRPQR